MLSSLLLLLALPPYDVWPLAWVGLVPLLVAVARVPWREAMALGALSGTVTNFLAFHWVLELMDRFSKLGPLAYLVMLAMSLYQGVPWALWCGLLRAPWSESRSAVTGRYALLWSAAAWAALEYFYPIIFPWYLANTQHLRPEVTSVIALGGVSLLTFALVLFNLMLASVVVAPAAERSPALWMGRFSPRGRAALVLASGLIPGLLVGYHASTAAAIEQAMKEAPKLAVGLVQPNEWIGQGDALQGLHDYQRMTYELVAQSQREGHPLDLVIWPESAVRTPPTTIERGNAAGTWTEWTGRLARYPLDMVAIPPSPRPPAASLQQETEVTQDELFAVQRGHGVPILFGTTLEDLSPQAQGPIPGRAPLYNCGVLLDGAGRVLGAVKKVKLLMFGETIPGSRFVPQVYRLLPAASALLPGEKPEVVRLGEARLGMMICYEDLLPWFHYQLAQERPQVLLNLTNDAWFGKTAEPICHLDLAALRAVEGRCYLVRSTPTGISAVIDPFGRRVAYLDSDQVGTLRQEVALLDVVTPFERWGDIVAWACLGAWLMLGGWEGIRRRRR